MTRTRAHIIDSSTLASLSRTPCPLDGRPVYDSMSGDWPAGLPGVPAQFHEGVGCEAHTGYSVPAVNTDAYDLGECRRRDNPDMFAPHGDVRLDHSSCVINPQDVDPDHASQNRTGLWIPGPLRHVVHALAGARVAIVTDVGTGHTLLGARLEDVRSGANGQELLVVTGHARTWYPLRSLGMILPLERHTGALGDAKWLASNTAANERVVATQMAQAAHPDIAAQEYTRWFATPLAREGSVHVRVYRTSGLDIVGGPLWYGDVHINQNAS